MTVRIGILGAAKIAPKAIIAPCSKRSDCEVVAVAARDPSKAKAYAETHNIPHFETNYEALVRRDDVDLIYNALPPARHADLSIAALEAGKSVLCEKPFAMNAAEALKMVQTAERTGGHLLEAFHHRFHPVFMHIMDVIGSGQLGTIKHIEAIFNVAIPDTPGELRHELALGGGALMDLGCYPSHWIRTVCGATPTVTSAEITEGRPGIDVRTVANLSLPNGGTATLTTDMLPNTAFHAFLDIKAENGRLRVENPLHPHLGHKIELTLNGETSKTVLESNSTYDYQLAHVLDVIHGNTAPLTGGTDALENMQLIDAIYQAGGLSVR